MSRFKAAFIHFCISASIVGPVLAVVFFVWYPSPFFEIVGAWDVVQVLVGVDLVLGPFLTLIVFKTDRRRLRFDLTVIALVQLSALGYGINAIYGERPYYMVFAVDRFSVLAEHDLAAPAPEEASFRKPVVGPVFAVAELPTDRDAHQKLLFELLSGAADIDRRPEFWVPYDGDKVLARAKPVAELVPGDQTTERRLARAVRRAGRPKEELVYVPALGKKDDVSTLLLGRSDARLLAVVALNPWALAVRNP